MRPSSTRSPAWSSPRCSASSGSTRAAPRSSSSTGRPALLALRDRDGLPVHGPAVPRRRDLRGAVAGRRPHPRLPSRGGRVVLGMVGLVGRPDRELHHERRSGRWRREGRRPLPRVVLGPPAVAPARRDLRRRHGARPSGARHDDRPDAVRRVGIHGRLAAPDPHVARAPRGPRADVGRPPVQPHRVRGQLRHQPSDRLGGHPAADLRLRDPGDRTPRRGRAGLCSAPHPSAARNRARRGDHVDGRARVRRLRAAGSLPAGHRPRLLQGDGHRLRDPGAGRVPDLAEGLGPASGGLACPALVRAHGDVARPRRHDRRRAEHLQLARARGHDLAARPVRARGHRCRPSRRVRDAGVLGPEDLGPSHLRAGGLGVRCLALPVHRADGGRQPLRRSARPARSRDELRGSRRHRLLQRVRRGGSDRSGDPHDRRHPASRSRVHQGRACGRRPVGRPHARVGDYFAAPDGNFTAPLPEITSDRPLLDLREAAEKEA